MFQTPLFVVEGRLSRAKHIRVGLRLWIVLLAYLCSPPTKDRQGDGESQLHFDGELAFPKEGGKMLPVTIPVAIQVQIPSHMCHAVATFSHMAWWLGCIPFQGPMSKYPSIRESGPSLFSNGLLPIEKLISPCLSGGDRRLLKVFL